jgi:Skp family chaperone for outer membrane proteins
MLEKLKQRLFPSLIALSALSVSASAAFYSVSGLSKLFAGAAFAVVIMAASLEVAKLVIASLLYQYRKNLPRLLKYYLSVACLVLILITSMGIYGFLSAAYQETASKAGSIDSKIALIETKRDNIKQQLIGYSSEKETIDKAVADLREGLSNNKIQYTNADGQLITTTSSSTRRALEKQLDQAIQRQGTINLKVDTLNERLFNYETEIVEVSTNSELAGELGPLKYLSGLTGTPMDKIINILLLTIIFVFDPLAIALVVAANFAFEQLRPKTKENIYGEIVEVEEEDIFEDLNTTSNNGLEQYPYDESIDTPINPVDPNPEKEPEPTPKQKNLESYKDPSQLSSYRRRKIEEEGKKYW